METKDLAGKGPERRDLLPVLMLGLLLLFMELWKQLYLYLFVFDRQYRVWYLPWQLCSMPIYLCLIYGVGMLVSGRKGSSHTFRPLAVFMADYGLLGGIAALLVPDGFTWPEHPLLTLHGYLWHVLLILLSLYLTLRGLSDIRKRAFLKTLPIFFTAALVAEVLNVLLHPFGDCDMFYISPYHLSSQPVFREIDSVIGRGPGILLYLAAVILGAFLCHLLLGRLYRAVHRDGLRS